MNDDRIVGQQTHDGGTEQGRKHRNAQGDRHGSLEAEPPHFVRGLQAVLADEKAHQDGPAPADGLANRYENMMMLTQ